MMEYRDSFRLQPVYCNKDPCVSQLPAYRFNNHIHILLLIFDGLFCFVLFLQKLYIVCDVALFVIVNKSTSCHLDCPKDPILPTKFFTTPDKVGTVSCLQEGVLLFTELFRCPSVCVCVLSAYSPCVSSCRTLSMIRTTSPLKLGRFFSPGR